MEFKLNVKDKSVSTFLSERLIDFKRNNEYAGSISLSSTSAYHLMKDELFFKKDCGINIGETVKIELFDRSQNSGKDLVNTYIYKAEEYDDIAIKMVLIKFDVNSVKPTKSE